jgi:tRNA 2-thiouridine synthesizing protein E
MSSILPTTSPQLNIEGFSFDADGYLCHIDDWSTHLALELAQHEHLELTALHWNVIHFVRQFYLAQHDMPKMRILIAHLRQQPEHAQITSATIHQLFPFSPALQIAKIAGLPKPHRCL